MRLNIGQKQLVPRLICFTHAASSDADRAMIASSKMNGIRQVFRAVAAVAVALWAMAASAGDGANLPGGRFMLQAQNGQVVTDQDFRGRYMLITFGYTWCPDICPTALSTMSQAMDELGRQAEQVALVFVSVDPKRDTPARLRDYIEHFHKNFYALTGPKPLVDKAAERYKVVYQVVPAADGDPEAYTIDHTASVYLIGPDGRFRIKFTYNIDPEIMAKRIREIINGGS